MNTCSRCNGKTCRIPAACEVPEEFDLPRTWQDWIVTVGVLFVVAGGLAAVLYP